MNTACYYYASRSFNGARKTIQKDKIRLVKVNNRYEYIGEIIAFLEWKGSIRGRSDKYLAALPGSDTIPLSSRRQLLPT